jgi:hypothetical protein
MNFYFPLWTCTHENPQRHEKRQAALKANRYRKRLGNAVRFFIFQKQMNVSTIENFNSYEKSKFVDFW